ncbi:MAG: hypothetical protein ACREVG_18390 [Burkholderiales bacterium]
MQIKEYLHLLLMLIPTLLLLGAVALTVAIPEKTASGEVAQPAATQDQVTPSN